MFIIKINHSIAITNRKIAKYIFGGVNPIDELRVDVKWSAATGTDILIWNTIISAEFPGTIKYDTFVLSSVQEIINVFF